MFIDKYKMKRRAKKVTQNSDGYIRNQMKSTEFKNYYDVVIIIPISKQYYLPNLGLQKPMYFLFNL